LNQHLCGDAEFRMQSPNHPDREYALAVEHLRNPSTRTQQGLQIVARQTLLFHSKLNCLNGVGAINRLMLRPIDASPPPLPRDDPQRFEWA
jgi:hypothetical protein